MAVATEVLGAVGTYSAVSVTADGAITKVQTGGPGGAYEFVDSAGNPAKVQLNGQEAASVFATIAESDVDAIATAYAAAIA